MQYILNIKPNKRIAHINNIKLSSNELIEGCELLIDSGADTCVAGKNACIKDVIKGVTVSARAFSDTLPIEEYLPIVNAVYAYDSPSTGEVILLETKHCIYMGEKKVDSIACPNQMRLNGVYVNDLLRQIFPNMDKVQTINADELRMPLHLHSLLALHTDGILTELTVYH